MKKILSLMAMAALLAACSPATPDSPEEERAAAFEETTTFTAYGRIAVPSQTFTLDSVRVEARLRGTTAIDIYLYEVTFSPQMPVRIDMIIPDAECTRTKGHINFTGDGIEPTMGGNPVARYVATGLQGTITPDSLTFTTAFGGMTCTYNGALVW
ncbi:MAG: hypothetical protein J6T64_09725 [Bacteroidaceae bacterium]|nr:hypothetical protein [Bacteroidaceae bacterium]